MTAPPRPPQTHPLVMKSRPTAWRSLLALRHRATCFVRAVLESLRGAGGEEKPTVAARSHRSGEAGRPQGGSGRGLTGSGPTTVGPSGSEPRLCHAHLAANLDLGVSHPFNWVELGRRSL